MDGMECGALVSDFLAELRSMGEQPPPFPSPELAALLVGGIPAPISSAPSRRTPDYGRRLAAACVAAAVGVVIALSAENSALSSSVQQFVSHVVVEHPAGKSSTAPTPVR